MRHLYIDTLILKRNDLKKYNQNKLSLDIELSDFNLYNESHEQSLLVQKKELIIFVDGSFSKILISRYFNK
jgi:hypothetical protein